MFTCSLLYRGTPDFELIVLTANVSVSSSPDFCIAFFLQATNFRLCFVRYIVFYSV